MSATSSDTKNGAGNHRSLLRRLPSVGRLLEAAASEPDLAAFGQPLLTETLRQTLDAARESILDGRLQEAPAEAALLAEAGERLQGLVAPTLHPVINATGVIIHTNLGRATLSRAAQAAVAAAASAYSTLEFDLPSGKRGSRSLHAEGLIRQVTGAEGGMVANNTAAALLLMLSALCQGREVIISRGQLIEIGGGFHIPDVLAQSGVRLVEVGTTNRTHLRDYEAAITPDTAAILVAHHSNFKIVGFATDPPLADLARLAHGHDLLLLYDQGSGCLLETSAFGLDHEPTVGEGLAAGCHLVAFSGDKLLGGPQAGILAGRASLVDICKKHPLARAVRADKLCLAGLSATLTHYLKEEALAEIPIWRLIGRTGEELAETVQRWTAYLDNRGIPGNALTATSTVGGGSLPGTTLPAVVLVLDHPHVDALAARLRRESPHVIGRIQDGRLHFDPRTVFPDQEAALLQAITNAWRAFPD